MTRKYVDCRDYPSDAKCSLRISGEEEEVIRAAAEHAVAVHQAGDTPEFRAELKSMLKNETDEAPQTQAA
jgi:predicted small metal-binding protein